MTQRTLTGSAGTAVPSACLGTIRKTECDVLREGVCQRGSHKRKAVKRTLLECAARESKVVECSAEWKEGRKEARGAPQTI